MASLDIETRLTNLENDNAELQRDNVQLKKENVELRKENVELRKENVELKKEIAQLKTQLYNAVQGNLFNRGRAVQCTSFSHDNVQCSVCTETMVVGDQCCILSACDHVFHTTCIVKWLSHNYPVSYNCPICRTSCFNARSVQSYTEGSTASV
jgi:regulator of replication initiation timing